MTDWPLIHDERNRPIGISFTDNQVIIALQDGRTLGIPLYFFPWLQSATDDQRLDCNLGACSAYWESLEEGIDMVAMLTGLYIGRKTRSDDVTAPASVASN